MKLIVNGTQSFMGIEIPVIEGGFGENKKCILAKDIAKIHGMELFNINKLIKNNLEEFDKGVDLLEMLGILSENTQIGEELGYTKDSLNSTLGKGGVIYLLSERGYVILSMLMKTDKAREIRKQFIHEYFTMREEMIKMAEHIKILEENQLLTENNKRLSMQSEYYKNDAQQQRKHIEDLTAERNDFNVSCDIPIRELKKDIKAFMKDFTEEKSDHMTRRGELYDSYVRSRRRRGIHPNIAQFEQILVDMDYLFAGPIWMDLRLDKSKIR